jgi:hypothetical protein
MTNQRYPITSILGAALLAAGCTTVATAAPQQTPARDCFASHLWDGWSAPGDGDALYLRVRMHDVYRAELTPGTHVRKYADNFLVNRIRGSNWICSALDLDLTLNDHQGFQAPLIVRSLRKLTPEEIAAIPRKDLP